MRSNNFTDYDKKIIAIYNNSIFFGKINHLPNDPSDQDYDYALIMLNLLINEIHPNQVLDLIQTYVGKDLEKIFENFQENSNFDQKMNLLIAWTIMFFALNKKNIDQNLLREAYLCIISFDHQFLDRRSIYVDIKNKIHQQSGVNFSESKQKSSTEYKFNLIDRIEIPGDISNIILNNIFNINDEFSIKKLKQLMLLKILNKNMSNFVDQFILNNRQFILKNILSIAPEKPFDVKDGIHILKTCIGNQCKQYYEDAIFNDNIPDSSDTLIYALTTCDITKINSDILKNSIFNFKNQLTPTAYQFLYHNVLIMTGVLSKQITDDIIKILGETKHKVLTNLSGSDLFILFSNTNLHCHLSHANLSNSYCKKGKIINANFKYARLSNITLEECQIECTDFNYADLTGSYLFETEIKTPLYHANFANSVFDHVYLNADLMDTNLSGINLSSTKIYKIIHLYPNLIRNNDHIHHIHQSSFLNTNWCGAHTRIIKFTDKNTLSQSVNFFPYDDENKGSFSQEEIKYSLILIIRNSISILCQLQNQYDNEKKLCCQNKAFAFLNLLKVMTEHPTENIDQIIDIWKTEKHRLDDRTNWELMNDHGNFSANISARLNDAKNKIFSMFYVSNNLNYTSKTEEVRFFEEIIQKLKKYEAKPEITTTLTTTTTNTTDTTSHFHRM